MARFLSLVLVLGSACWPTEVARATAVDPGAVLEAIVWMDHQASLVHSARAEFTVRYQPTSPEEMQRIQALCRQRGQEHRAGGYYLSQRQASRRSYHSLWWRSGVREREEKTHIARPAIVETTVFDGQVVRTLDGTPGRSCLYLASPATHWTHKSRVQPFAFAFEYRSAPHGSLVRESPQRRVLRRRLADEGRWEVTARHADDEKLIVRLVFDDQHRLVERDAILTRATPFMELDNNEPAVYSRCEFSDFRPYDDGAGNRLWFPSRVVLRYFLGNLMDGTPVQNMAMAIDVDDIEFNVDIPDAKFQLVAPEGIPTQDHRDGRYSIVGVSY